MLGTIAKTSYPQSTTWLNMIKLIGRNRIYLFLPSFRKKTGAHDEPLLIGYEDRLSKSSFEVVWLAALPSDRRYWTACRSHWAAWSSFSNRGFLIEAFWLSCCRENENENDPNVAMCVVSSCRVCPPMMQPKRVRILNWLWLPANQTFFSFPNSIDLQVKSRSSKSRLSTSFKCAPTTPFCFRRQAKRTARTTLWTMMERTFKSRQSAAVFSTN